MTYATCQETAAEETDSPGLAHCERYPLPFCVKALDGRFHPIEKAIQYAVDTLPFALLGVSNEVLAAYCAAMVVQGIKEVMISISS